MRTTLLFLTLFLLLASRAGAVEDASAPRVFHAEGMRFELGDEGLSFFVEDGDSTIAEATIRLLEKGRLFVAQREIETDRRDRKLLARFYDEAAKLSALIESVSADLTAQLSPDLDQGAAEKIARRIQRTGQRMEKHTAELGSLAQELVLRIPELAVLERLGEE